MGFETYGRFVLALLFVVLLILACAWVARRLGFAGRLAAVRSSQRRLAILEVLPLDGKRRLVLLKRDGVEHLVLLGQPGDLVIERGSAGDFSGMIEGGAP
ncbi:MAG TPA: flagellar biosynthetic protein FliO [Stellaceae bacterium]|jgi:flagellar protein FliO/FliZ|nr:flagellar biosynthetic protein FliO [Stellaceae bacterium]